MKESKPYRQVSTRPQKIQWLIDNHDLWRGIVLPDKWSGPHIIDSIGLRMKEAGLYSESYTPTFWGTLRMMKSVKSDLDKENCQTFEQLGS